MNSKLVTTMDKIEPESSLKDRTYDKVCNYGRKTKKKLVSIASVAAIFLCVVSCVGISYVLAPAIKIPEKQIDVNSLMLADGPRFLIYNNKYYREDMLVDYEEALMLLDHELGTTNTDDWEFNKEAPSNDDIKTAPDLMSNFSNGKIYTLKTYDENFRLICLWEGYDSTKYASLYEAPPYGETIRKGKDFFSKLNIGRAESAEYYSATIDNERNYSSSKSQRIDENKLKIINDFLKKLSRAKPYDFEGFTSITPSDSYRTIIIDTNNIIKTRLDIWKEGNDCFVAYGTSYKIVFKADKASFEKIWEITN
ncbi:MAG: hypothetical protein E7388_02900 [Ruminococcaceae bacterium]|nr:hypothetical protein [Oscillospiraceae bacterium]